MESVKSPFDVARDIFTKTCKFEQYTADDISAYQPFMVNRICSMIRDPYCVFMISKTVNKTGFVGNDKEMHFKLMQRLMPLCGGLRMGDYIKKTPRAPIDRENLEKEKVNLLWYSENLSIPYKELVMYKDLFGIEFEDEEGPKRKKKSLAF